MKNLKSSHRSYLSSKAHHLKPLIHIGNNGLIDGTIRSIKIALAAKELIKIKFQEYKDDKQELSENIASDTQSHVVRIIGHTLILFKQNDNLEKQQYRLP